MTTRRRGGSGMARASGGSGMTKTRLSAGSRIWTKAKSEEPGLAGGRHRGRRACGRGVRPRPPCLPTVRSRGRPVRSVFPGPGATPAADGFGDSDPVRGLHVAAAALVELFVPRQEVRAFFLEPAEEDVVDLAAQVEGDTAEEGGPR